MLEIMCTLGGIFIGVATAGYMFASECIQRDRKIYNQEAMINNRDKLIDGQLDKLIHIKAIVNSEDMYITKIDKIKELFELSRPE